jgi:hypothetical protein
MRTDLVAVSTAVNRPRNDEGRIARWLYGLLTGGAPPGTRTPNPRIKSANSGTPGHGERSRLVPPSAVRSRSATTPVPGRTGQCHPVPEPSITHRSHVRRPGAGSGGRAVRPFAPEKTMAGRCCPRRNAGVRTSSRRPEFAGCAPPGCSAGVRRLDGAVARRPDWDRDARRADADVWEPQWVRVSTSKMVRQARGS